MLHYPKILLDNGPIVKFWSMRFESYHQLIKRNANSSNNARNLLKTIAKKQALKLCEMIYNFTYESEIKFGSLKKTNERKPYFSDKINNNQCQYYDEVDICNTIYNIGTFVVINMEECEIEFGKITNIIHSNNDIYFDLEVFEEVTFDEHVHAYIVEFKDENKLIKFSDLSPIAPLHSIT